MDIGLLWYDDDPKKTLERKIGEAAERYRQRFGVLPNACHIHGNGDEARQAVGKVAVIPNRAVRPHYLWIGLEVIV